MFARDRRAGPRGARAPPRRGARRWRDHRGPRLRPARSRAAPRAPVRPWRRLGARIDPSRHRRRDVSRALRGGELRRDLRRVPQGTGAQVPGPARRRASRRSGGSSTTRRRSEFAATWSRSAVSRPAATSPRPSTLKVRDEGGPAIAFQLLEIPALDLTFAQAVRGDLRHRLRADGARHGAVPRRVRVETAMTSRIRTRRRCSRSDLSGSARGPRDDRRVRRAARRRRGVRPPARGRPGCR